MSKLIELHDQGRIAKVQAETIIGYAPGGKRGAGSFFFSGQIVNVDEKFEKSRDEWVEYMNTHYSSPSKTFEYKDVDDHSIIARLSDVKTIRQHGTRGVVHMNDHVTIHSSESYSDLRERFIDALNN